jgi:hypothetical protein
MHTPGPWWIDDDGFVASGSGDTYTTIADPHCGNQDIDEREANARLIAKAPDLRDALQNLLTAIHHRENNPGFASAGNYVRALERARALLED